MPCLMTRTGRCTKPSASRSMTSSRRWPGINWGQWAAATILWTCSRRRVPDACGLPTTSAAEGSGTGQPAASSIWRRAEVFWTVRPANKWSSRRFCWTWTASWGICTSGL
ncbi:hypothetical protein D3C81_1778170 [compost metagenome]